MKVPLLILAIAFCASARPVQAHPHVWVSMKTTIVAAADGSITALRHRWVFDELYSSFATQGLDKDGDGKFSREELRELAEINIKSLKDFGYFTFAKTSGSAFPQNEPVDYWVDAQQDGTVALNLTVPFTQPLPRAKLDSFSFSIYDPSNYVAFGFQADAPVSVENLPGCSPMIGAPPTDPGVLGSKEEILARPEAFAGLGADFAPVVTLACARS